MLVNIKIGISGCNKITFQGYRLRYSSFFFMEQLKTKLAILALLYCGDFVKTLFYVAVTA